MLAQRRPRGLLHIARARASAVVTAVVMLAAGLGLLPAAAEPRDPGDAVDLESSLTLTKTASPTTVRAVGEVVTYRFVATNTGRTPLTGLVVVDELPGLSPLRCSPSDHPGPGEAVSCVAIRVTTQDDLDFGSILNVALVSAEAPGGDPDDPVDDVTAVADASVAVEVSTGLRVQVEADRDPLVVGRRAGWSFTATNTGNVTLTHVRLASPLQR